MFLLPLAAAAGGFSVDGPDAPKPWEKTAVRELEDYLAKLMERYKTASIKKTR